MKRKAPFTENEMNKKSSKSKETNGKPTGVEAMNLTAQLLFPDEVPPGAPTRVTVSAAMRYTALYVAKHLRRELGMEKDCGSSCRVLIPAADGGPASIEVCFGYPQTLLGKYIQPTLEKRLADRIAKGFEDAGIEDGEFRGRLLEEVRHALAIEMDERRREAVAK